VCFDCKPELHGLASERCYPTFCLLQNTSGGGDFPAEGSGRIGVKLRKVLQASMDLEGKLALVTGAARRIGRAIALGLARAGADIALHYRRSLDDARRTAGEISSLGRRVELFEADLARPEQIDKLFGDIDKAFGRLNVLVNNASICQQTPLDSLTARQWDRQFAVNARAPALCIGKAAPLMPAGSAIINIVDISAEKPWARCPAYCASKAALLALTRSAARALAPKIRVNAVSPGAILWSEDMTDRGKEAVLAHVPMGRAGCPEDIAAAVVFLARADYVTGQNLRVDGGRSMT